MANEMKKLRGIFLAACLILASTTASAIPIPIEVEIKGSAFSYGAWGLFGPTFLSDRWGGFGRGGGTYSYSGHIAEGTYGFLIGGNTGRRGVRWRVTVGTEVFTGGKHGEFKYFLRGGHFTATKVPEPGTLAVLGIGLLGMGLARRRKRG